MDQTAGWPLGGGETGALIRARDWSRTPLGPIEGWPQSLRTAVGIMLGSPAPTSVMWGPEHVQLYNDAYLPVAQERHPAIFGGPALEGWADARAFLGPIFRDILAGGSAAVQDQTIALRRADGGDPEVRVFRATFSPIPDGNGGIGGIFHTLEETTAAVRVMEALRESEDRLRLTMGAAELGIWEHDLRTDLFHLDARAQALYGLPRAAPSAELVGRVHPEDRERLGGEFSAAMDPAVRGPVSTEYRVTDAEGGVRWLRVRGRVYFTDGGGGAQAVRGLGTVQDVTEERRAEAALRASEARQAFLVRLGDTLRPLLDAGEIQYQAARALGEHLRASRVGYAEAGEDGETLVVTRDYTQGVPGIEGRLRFDDYGPALLREFRAGRTVVHPDIAADPTLTEAEKQAHAVLQVGANVDVPLVKEGRLMAVLFVHHREPRRFSAGDLALVQTVAERTWAAVVRARAEAALRESEARFRLMADAVPQIVWITDAEGRAEFLNRQWTRYTGLPYEPGTAAEVAAASVHPDDAVLAKERFEQARRTGATFQAEYRIRSASGEYRWFLVRGEPYRDAGTGEIVRWFGASVDIHDRRVAEEALRRGEERLRLALDVAELGTWSWDLTTGAGDLDARGAEIIGLSPGPLADVGRAQRGVIHPGDLARVEADVAAGLAGGRDFTLQYRVVHPDGGVRHVASRAHVLADDAGRPAGLVGTSRDVTAEREAEARLRESEQKYRTLFESIDEGFCVVQVLFDEHGAPVDYRFLEANPVFASQTGLVDPVGRTAREMVPGLEPFWTRTYGRVALTGEPTRFEDHSPSMGRWFDVNALRVGQPGERRVAILFKDVTARKQAELERERLVAALRVERERLVEVIRRAPAFMAVLREPGLVLELVNDAFQQLIGHRDVVGKPLFDAVPDARGQGFEEKLDHVLASGEPFVGRGLPVVLRRTPGAPPEERIIDLAYVPLTEADGTRTGLVALGTDVTEQVQARRQIEAARDRAERLQALTAALAGARTVDDVADVVVADMVVALGARTGALAGRAPEGDALVLLRTIGVPGPVEAGVRQQPLDLRSPLVACYATRSPIWIETREGPQGLDRRYPPSAPVWDALGVSSAVFVPLEAAGETVGVISFAFETPRRFAPEERDFLLALGQQAALAVERARLFEAEHAARAEAERANRAKSEFLAVMSHELRTPLNAIGGYAELMEMGIRGPITPQQAEDLRRVQTSQRHLLGLINEVLNYAKLETGTVHYDVAEVRLRDAIAGAEALVSPQAQAKELALGVHPCPPDLCVRADAEKVRQILVNLLSNAVKFTDSGGRVEVLCEAGDERVQVRVRDTGIGIPADQLDRIFEPFVQVRADLTRTAEGTGLGLAISRDLARGMGGDLTAESALGAGSTFTLTLPRA